MIWLENDKLKFGFLEPGEKYQRTRFDWNGICEKVILKPDIQFTSQEAASRWEKGTEGLGLCNEFGLITPVGYNEISKGQYFPKIGIGFLLKKKKSYNFMKNYKLIPAATNLKQDGESRLIYTQNAEHNDYGWKYKKSFTIKNQTLKITMKLTNTGTKNIKTEEYCHNFLTLNNQPLDQNYSLTLSHKFDFDYATKELYLTDKQIKLKQQPKKYFFAEKDNWQPNGNVTWELKHKYLPFSITCEERHQTSRFALWGMKHVISPEVFKSISLKLNESDTWSRIYYFK